MSVTTVRSCPHARPSHTAVLARPSHTAVCLPHWRCALCHVCRAALVPEILSNLPPRAAGPPQIVSASAHFAPPPHPTPSAGGSAYPHEGGKGGALGNGKDMGYSGISPEMVDRKIEEALEKMRKELAAAAPAPAV